MSLNVLRGAAATLVFGGTLLLGACSETTEPAGATVQVQDDTFNPMNASVSTGATVTWNWTGANVHNVTWVNTSGATDSPDQSSGTYNRTFDAAGTFDYYCEFHGTATAGMRGSVVVQ